MKSFFHTHNWVYSAVLYALSWISTDSFTLSFLAWFAFVPLFLYLKKQTQRPSLFLTASFAVILCWGVASAGWLFHFPTNKGLVLITFLVEIAHIWTPFLFLYLIQRNISFERALIVFPFIWTSWEWIYLGMDHTMGTHLLSYGQGDNLWLIQMADLGGMWLISFWVMALNVCIYFAYRTTRHQIQSRAFLWSIAKIGGIFMLLPSIYSIYSFQDFTKKNEANLQVTIFPTHHDPNILLDRQHHKKTIESILHRTDSTAFNLISQKRPSDLYVWPESGTINWYAFANMGSILSEASEDWSAPLLTGAKSLKPDETTQELFVSGVLIDPFSNQFQYHHKTKLVPGTEQLPYEKLWSRLGLNHEKSPFAPGQSHEPLSITTQNDNTREIGVSICYEQWFPEVWTNQTNNGAQLFVHIAEEGWCGDNGYKRYMANVSRFRAIENRRSIARCSNKGRSLFIKPTGEFYEIGFNDSERPLTAQVTLSNKLTLFNRYPGAVPTISFALIILLILQFNLKRISSLKQNVRLHHNLLTVND